MTQSDPASSNQSKSFSIPLQIRTLETSRERAVSTLRLNVVKSKRSSQQNSLAECARHPADREKRDYTGHPAGLKFVDSWRPVLTKQEEDGNIKPSRLDLEGVNRMTDIVRLLLDAGSDPNVTDDNRMTPPSLVVVMRLRGRFLLAETHQTYPVTASAEQGQERKTLPSLKHDIWLRE